MVTRFYFHDLRAAFGAALMVDFSDPSGDSVELACYEPGMGWRDVVAGRI
mgnify:CR=1 FL=1